MRDSALVTVENKTSYLRHLPEGMSSLFLSGYAAPAQIGVLRRIVTDNPGLKLYHFGDIDAGGLRILKHLRNELGVHIEPYHMGIEELKDPRYEKCLITLTENDRERLAALEQDFSELTRYMLANNCKLEQEIVSLYLEGVSVEV